MEFQKTVLKRRMVRHFAKDTVPDRVLNKILELAQHYPSAGFSQGVAYVVIKDPEVRKNVGLIQEEHEYVKDGFHPFISEAPVVIVITVNEEHYHRRYQESDKLQPSGTEIAWPTPYWFFDAGAASMIILLAAIDMGYAAGFAGVSNIDGMRDLLGIPAEFHPVGTISIGKPLPDRRSDSLKRGRRPHREVVHAEHW